MRYLYRGVVYEAVGTKEAYAFANYLGRPIAGFIEYFKNNILTGNGGYVGDWAKYSEKGYFRIPLSVVLKGKLTDKKGNSKNSILGDLLFFNYDLIIDHTSITKNDGRMVCYNTTRELAKEKRAYIEIANIRRSPASILRTVEHELVHAYHCISDLPDFRENVMKNKGYFGKHEILANLKGLTKAVESEITSIKTRIVSARSKISKYAKGDTSIDIKSAKNDLTSNIRELRSIVLHKDSFLDYIESSWKYLVTNYSDYFSEDIADDYLMIFEELEPRLVEVYKNLKNRGFFSVSLDEINGLSE